MRCNICPRRCNADREAERGFCGGGNTAVVNRISRHMLEEPSISGTRGSGTVFFAGCSLGCAFCQNSAISRREAAEDGRALGPEELSAELLRLAASGVHNINLVTPTHFSLQLIEALRLARPHLGIPVVWNSSGYESVRTLSEVLPLIDIYMPDMKFFSPELSSTLASAPDYAERALEAIVYAAEVLGAPIFDSEGLLCRGVLVRHLVLPGFRRDSLSVLRALCDRAGPERMLLSLMSQYTPDFYRGDEKSLHRRLTSFEYDSVSNLASELGFRGYTQSRDSASSLHTPPFKSSYTEDF